MLRRSFCPAVLLAVCLAVSLCSVDPSQASESQSPELQSIEPQSIEHRGSILEFRGLTMGTTYMVKIFDPPSFAEPIEDQIDAELRRVNDQMSTYLKSSELSRFNDSGSTDWFDVSHDTAIVVDAGLEISKASNGAFDPTVGPLVNAWSFGPDPKTKKIPSDERIAELRKSVGYQHLAVRMEPPALRKSIPNLRVDLSAIAKGHGVDRIVALLGQAGAKNVFVEIGGEVRTTGSKGEDSWKVGIQNPQPRINNVASENREAIAVAHPLTNRAMATSGDYQKFFEIDGVRYSHTIDPRTGRPIENHLASVSVIHESCMKADGWATAINVLGSDAGLRIAQEQSLDVFILLRNDSGIERFGTGVLKQYADQASEPLSAARATEVPWLARFMPTLIVTMIGFAVFLTAMAIGVMLGGKRISGSCGGLAGKENPDGSVSCSMCGNPSEGCKELRKKIQSP